MSTLHDERPAIEITGRARDALLAHLRGDGEADGKRRYVRIHVGRG